MRKDIYIIKNDINKKVYIGQAKNAKTRFQGHCKPSSANNEIIGRAINKYGREHFWYEILEHNVENYNEREKYWIKIFYLSLSTIYTDFFFTDEEIKNNLPILFDNRNIIIQGKENIDVILTMLKNHLQNLKIHLKNTINEKIFEINKG